MATDHGRIVYWDASALLSALFQDSHTGVARSMYILQAFHILSTLAYAETCAVIGRLLRERLLDATQAGRSHEMLAGGPWRRTNAAPDWDLVRSLSGEQSLRGADLWHLATARTLQRDLPEIEFLTFDARLGSAAGAAGLRVVP